MKNHKGFTLVEILAVIVVLGLLAAIITPVVSNLLKDSEESLSNEQINNIIVIAKKYAIEHSDILPDLDSGDSYELDIETLIADGYIDINNFIDPRTKKAIRGYVNIYYDATFNQYQYEFVYGGISLALGTEFLFDYVSNSDNKEQMFNVPKNGYYKLEVWGAQGGQSVGDFSDQGIGGYGAYSMGVIKLNKDQTLYINVGGQGEKGSTMHNAKGGYNGGGNATSDNIDDESAGGGGGATHVALVSGELKDLSNNQSSVIIVAGGGGGGAWYSAPSAGGFRSYSNNYSTSSVATQSSGFAFGLGQSAPDLTPGVSTLSEDGVAGAGGGFYGGYVTDVNGRACGTGGSSYIGNDNLLNKKMVCYNCDTDDLVSTKTETTTCHDSSAKPSCSKEKNGYVKITYLGTSIQPTTLAVGEQVDFASVGEHSYLVTTSGNYKLEVWGAQGGQSVGNDADQGIGGYGAYSVGEYHLVKGQTIYVNVGGQGEKGSIMHNAKGGYNGGGNATSDNIDDESAGGGGGATHVALVSGELKDLSNNQSSVIIVAGGGGGGAWYSAPSAGGFRSYSNNYSTSSVATQSSGFAFGLGQSAPDLTPGVSTLSEDGVAGAGGGFYGGYVTDVNGRACGTGGSSYIGNDNLLNKKMVCYNCDTDDLVSTKTETTTCHDSSVISSCSKEGNGYVIITYLGN